MRSQGIDALILDPPMGYTWLFRTIWTAGRWDCDFGHLYRGDFGLERHQLALNGGLQDPGLKVRAGVGLAWNRKQFLILVSIEWTWITNRLSPICIEWPQSTKFLIRPSLEWNLKKLLAPDLGLDLNQRLSPLCQGDALPLSYPSYLEVILSRSNNRVINPPTSRAS